MEKRSSIHSNSKLEISDETVYHDVILVLLKAVTLTATGKVTGRTYIFNGAGSKSNVDERDADFLLARTSKSCCSGIANSPYFEIVR